MPSTDASTRPAVRDRRWSLIAAIASVTVFGLSVGQGGPLMPLLLEQRGISTALNGLNAGVMFVGVLVGPLLAPWFVQRCGIRIFLLVCFALDIVLVLALKPFNSVAAWFVLRPLGAVVGSSIFTAGEAWINQLAGDAGRGRVIGIYAAALSAGFGIGPLVLSMTGIEGWAPFVVNAVITALAMLPLLGARDASAALRQGGTAGPLRMFVRAPAIVATVSLFGLYESALVSLLPVWGVRSGVTQQWAMTNLSAVYLGSILLQIAIGWLSDRISRIAALRLCALAGVFGALALLAAPPAPPVLFALLFVWGGIASGIYPVALSMAGDRFRNGDLLSVNAAMIMAYGLGAMFGPPLGGIAMDLRDPQGLLWLFGVLFAILFSASTVVAQPRQAISRQ
ncbi:MAG TPA: MFS transporter [Acetobacteraceae bacterium]|nr:MFS transporter [Acetobacteraceae bacterium]